ncbi:hypothetical protein O6H91_09G122700 [Diphasiastrum complanatum]|uniref:Uncharacterized protein n=2 Tax=Diphasiastrum complanatum TaxID=34168 RepID=A0ACC2CU63_DIPCM|nr:hypothetical protein O6H91_09G122700 [Diphasiastrum complanatum]KAJ7545501.1 hypothetical protein O6H91_09G122700 [Diphasiastrum complanatum]
MGCCRKSEESSNLSESDECLRKEHGASLLAITSDGSVWLLDLNQQNHSLSRPTKKQKEATRDGVKQVTGIVDQKKASDVQEPSFSKHKLPKLQSKQDEWGLFDDIDMYDSQELFGFEDVLDTKKKVSSSTTKHVEATQKRSSAGAPAISTSNETQPLMLLWRKFKVSILEETPQKLKVQLVAPTMSLGVVPGACLACFGPHRSVIVLTLLGTLKIFQAGSGSAAAQAYNPLGNNVLSTGESHQTCVLFASVVGGTGEGSIQLSTKFLGSIFAKCGIQQATNAVFTGDTAGRVHAIPVDISGTTMWAPILLCELKEPILALLAVSSVAPAFETSRPGDGRSNTTTTDKSPFLKSKTVVDARTEQEPREYNHLLVIGKQGRVMAMYPKNKREESFHSLFLSADCLEGSSWANHHTFAGSHMEGLVLRDWVIKFPVVEACILGSAQLCYCTGSRIFVMDLFEDVNFSYDSFGSHRPAAAVLESSAEGITRKKLYRKYLHRRLRETFVSREVPLSDTVVHLISKVSFSGTVSGRPVVALTSKGRLLSVEVSEHSLLTGEADSSSSAEFQKSWSTVYTRTKARFTELIEKIAEATQLFNAVQRRVVALNFAIHELAAALHIAYHLSTGCCSDFLKRPASLPDGYKLIRQIPESQNLSTCRLWCSLTVYHHPSISLSAEHLQFSHCNHQVPFSSTAVSYDCSTSPIRLSVDLYNHSSFPLSHHWSMLLKVGPLISSCKSVASFSTIINSGRGLPIGGHCTSDFDFVAPCKNWEPLLASIYLCHIHDFHKLLLDSSGSDNTASDDCFHVSPYCYEISAGKLLNGDEELQFWNECASTRHAGSSTLDEGAQGFLNTPGAACFLLSQYRIDVLSFLMPPTSGLGYKLYDILSESQGHTEHVFGSFSGSITLQARPDQMDAKATELWALFCLEDLVQRSNLKVGNELVMSTPAGGMVSFSLDKEVAEDGIEAFWRVKLQASSLQVGCLVREAILSRLEEREKNTRFSEGSGNLHSSADQHELHCLEKATQFDPHERLRDVDDETLMAVMKNVEKIGHRAEVLLRCWEDVRACAQQEGTDIVINLLNDTYALVQELLEAYRTFCKISPLR